MSGKTGIIGTAGRDKTKPMTAALWEKMLEDARRRTLADEYLVSGGAAWADHLAVTLFLEGHVKKLLLHLPAPLRNGSFVGFRGGAGDVTEYYHSKFSKVIGRNTVADIEKVLESDGCSYTFEPDSPNHQPLFVRNLKVARDSDFLLAYTWSPTSLPSDGGTSFTWDRCRGERVHVSLSNLI